MSREYDSEDDIDDEEEEEEEEEEGGDDDDEEEEDDDEEEPEPEPVKKRRTQKKKKDPNKPKRNMSAFFLYSNANRARVKEENAGAAFGEVAKLLSAEFKALPEKEAKKWEKKAQKDKLRYQEEMRNYVPPSEDEDEDDDDEKPKKKRKKVKDPNKPKRNQSAFFLYSNAHRAEVRERNPEAAFGDIAKIISAEFKRLPDKERKKWDKKAAKDKERYQEEMRAYNEEHG